MISARHLLGAVLMAACLQAQPQPAVPPVVRPMGPALSVQPPFGFDKEKVRRAVSGVACTAQSENRRCLVVFDEGTKAQFAVLGTHSLQPVGRPFELTGNGGELDAEGAALADGYYYVAGSHSVKRTSCKSNEASRMLIRFRAGLAAGSPTVSDLERTTKLWDLMKQDDYLRLHLDGCLGEGTGTAAREARRPGINIEGIAVVAGRLYAGFRGPSESGVVPVFSVDAKVLFEGGEPKPQLHRLALGDHVGIRDMAAARDAILLLLGPDDTDADVGWRVAQWRPNSAEPPRTLATLDVRKSDVGGACFEALKPEALQVLDESTSRFRVLVMSDGVCDGGPLVFEVPR